MTFEEKTNEVTAVEQDAPRAVPPPGNRVARITILFGPNAGRTYKLADDCVIGRSKEAGVVLADRGVSRMHARLRQLGSDRYVLEDLSSRNGTLLDGRRVFGSTELRPGARIQVGPRCLLLFSVHDDLEDSLLLAKKMEIIGRLSAGINHDFNNLLCVVLANAAFLLELPQKVTLADPEVRDCLDDMRSAAQAGAELTSRLATLVQGGPFVHERVDVSKLCEDIVAVLRNTLPRGVRIESRVEPGIELRGVRAHLWQLLLNPALNARDAMPDGGTLSMEVVRATADELEHPPHVQAESYAVITFTDTGRGMSPEVLRSAFEPFFTTKEIDLGRGLGLATVRKVASEHGGTVALSSRLGAGSTLRIVLPLPEAQDGELAAPSASKITWDSAFALREVVHDPEPLVTARPPQVRLGQGSVAGELEHRRVLLVESDRALARACGRTLRGGGFDVFWAQDGARARELFDEHGAAINLVVLDADASDPALAELQTALRARAPETPIIALTEAPDAHGPGRRPGPNETVLRKPIDLGMLARVVAQVLRRRPSRP